MTSPAVGGGERGGEGGREGGGRSMKRVSTVGGFPQGHTREGGGEGRLGIDHISTTTAAATGGGGGREGARETLLLGRYTDERARGQLAQNLW